MKDQLDGTYGEWERKSNREGEGENRKVKGTRWDTEEGKRDTLNHICRAKVGGSVSRMTRNNEQ